MAGINRYTGKKISGWPEVAQGLQMILTTEIGERVMRRGFGSRSASLLDRPANAESILDHYSAIADAIEPRIVNGHQYGEPRFDLARITPRGDESGHIRFDLTGIYYPRGHLGDFSIFEIVTGTVGALEDAATQTIGTTG